MLSVRLIDNGNGNFTDFGNKVIFPKVSLQFLGFGLLNPLFRSRQDVPFVVFGHIILFTYLNILLKRQLTTRRNMVIEAATTEELQPLHHMAPLRRAWAPLGEV